MVKTKDTIVAEDSMVRELLLSDGWKQVVEVWLVKRLEDLKEHLVEGLDHDEYFETVGRARQIKEVLNEVNRLGSRKSADIPEPE